jgi:hypothetical protein
MTFLLGSMCVCVEVYILNRLEDHFLPEIL